MTTIADVAREAGVSVSTVSHVVNGTRRVAPATAQAVQGRDRPDRLSPQRPGPLPQDGLDAVGRHRDFGDRQRLFHRHHLRDRDRVRPPRHDGLPLGHPGRPGPRTCRCVIALHQRRVDGVILAPSADPRAARACLSQRRSLALRARRSHARPHVRSGRRQQSRGDAGAGRTCRAGSGIAASAISAVIPASRPPSERIVGYRDSLERLGLAFDERYLVTGSASTAIRRRARPMRCCRSPDPPTAIVDRQQHGDDRGDAGHPRARTCGFPQDISIVGFDDFEWADCFEPRLTLVAQPCEEIGRRAAFLLMERIAAPEARGERCASTPR